MKTKLLLYCTKNKWRLFFDKVKQIFSLGKIKSNNDLNGKIVAECDYEVEEIIITERGDYNYDCFSSPEYCTNTLSEDELCEKSCLYIDDIDDYLNAEKGYAIHIKNLNIFDEPKELSDFNRIIETTYGEEPNETITRAPQNMMRCCYETNSKEWKLGILISIQSQEMCKILNREKDVEIRKVVLKEMFTNEN